MQARAFPPCLPGVGRNDLSAVTVGKRAPAFCVRAVDGPSAAAAVADLPPAEVTWQIVVGAVAGATPFVVAGVEFSKRIPEDYQKKWEEIEKIAKGPPDMPFRQEIDRIDDYTMKVHNNNILDCAILARGMPGEYSLHTIKQTVQMFVNIIVSTAEDSYHKKVTKETIVSFLGGLEGVAAISHILVQDTLKNHFGDSKEGSLNYSADYYRARLEYIAKMNILKQEFMTAKLTDAYQILESTLADAIMCTKIFVRSMNAYREWTLGHVPGRNQGNG